jgi:DNA-binding response OmpR family regulator
MKILVFGFDAREQPLIERALASLGHQAYMADEPGAAAAKVGEEKIMAAIADGRVPKFEWLELCRRLRADPGQPFVYILLHSGPDSEESHEAWAAELGVDDFLTELADERELWRKLRVAGRMVETSRRMRQFEASLAICTHCKRVRDEVDHWRDLDDYIGGRLRGQLTAVICPDCYIKRFGPEFRVTRITEAPLKTAG